MSVHNRNDYTVLALAARTATVTATDLAVPQGCRNVEIIDKLTAVTDTPSRVITIHGPGGELLLTSAAITTSLASTVLRYGLDFPVVANLSAPGIPVEGMTVTVTAGDADSATYSIVRRIS